MLLLKRPRDRREHPRIKLKVPGRYVLEDGAEYQCTIVDVSVGGLSLTGPKPGRRGERVLIYADKLGRVMGNVVRHYRGGFAVALDMSGIAGQRFAARLYEIEAPQGLNDRVRFGLRRA